MGFADYNPCVPDIQAILDGAALGVSAPITLEDRDFRLLAHTDHTGLIDPFRQSMIIGRRATPEVHAWFAQWEPGKAEHPFRTPADKRLGVFERWCVPVRFRNVLLGHLWVLDARGIAEDELGSVVEAADQIGALLYRRRVTSQADADLLRLLLIPTSGDDGMTSEARALGSFAPRTPVAVVVAGPPGREELTDAALGDLSLVVQRAAEQAPPNSVLPGVIDGLGVLLTRLRTLDDLAPARRLADGMRSLASHVDQDLAIVAAIGGPKELEHADQSYAEARRALRMLRAMPDLGPVATWDELGVFRALALLPSNELESGIIDPRVRGLLSDENLTHTAETFLDLAGDVQETAARLFVHRTTLYQRLERIALLYKLDLRRNGDHRLITHLGLKLARVRTV